MSSEKFDRTLFTQLLKCTECGHVQEATPAAVGRDDNGRLYMVCGSKFSYCDVCDGYVEEFSSKDMH